MPTLRPSLAPTSRRSQIDGITPLKPSSRSSVALARPSGFRLRPVQPTANASSSVSTLVSDGHFEALLQQLREEHSRQVSLLMSELSYASELTQEAATNAAKGAAWPEEMPRMSSDCDDDLEAVASEIASSPLPTVVSNTPVKPLISDSPVSAPPLEKRAMQSVVFNVVPDEHHVEDPEGNDSENIIRGVSDSSMDEKKKKFDRSRTFVVKSSNRESDLRRRISGAGNSDSADFRHRLRRFISHPCFEVVSMCIVFVNVVVAGVQIDNMVVNLQREVQVEYILTEAFCFVFFFVEVVLSLVADWKNFFFGPGRVLNTLDVVLVGFQMLEIIITSILLGSARREVNFALWRVLRLARLIRLARSVKLLQLFEEVRSTAVAVVVAIKPLMGSGAILLVILYASALVFADLALDERLRPDISAQDKQKLDDFFGSVNRAIYTLSISVFQGIDWATVSEHLPAPARDVLFPLFVMFTTLGFFNVVTGIFVESTIDRINRDRSECLDTIAKDIFSCVASPEGGLCEEDIVSIVQSGKADRLLTLLGMDEYDLSNVFSIMLSQKENHQYGSEAEDEVGVDAYVDMLRKFTGAGTRLDQQVIISMLQGTKTTGVRQSAFMS